MRRTLLGTFALLCTASLPHHAPRAHPMRELQFPQDVSSVEEHDIARAQAYATPAGVHFEIAGPPRIAAGRVTLRGRLVNGDPVPHDVIYFPAGTGGFYVQFVVGQGVTPRPPRPGVPMPPAPVPPPPQRFQIPARSSISMSGEILLSGYTYAPGTHAQIQWEYDFQNPPRPSGRIDVVLP